MSGIYKMVSNADKRRYREQYGIPNQNSSRAVRQLGFNSMAEFYREAQREEVIENVRRRTRERATRRIQQGASIMRQNRAIDNLRQFRLGQQIRRTAPVRRAETILKYGRGRYAPAGVRQFNLDFSEIGMRDGNLDEYWSNFWQYRVLPLLYQIRRMFRDTNGEGRVGINVYGIETTNLDDYGTPRKYDYTVRKIGDIDGLMKEWMEQTFSQSRWYFQPEEIEVNYIPVLKGGKETCPNKYPRGRMKTLVNLKIWSPPSTNNNCFFKCIEKEINSIKGWRSTKTQCNAIRKKFGIEENHMISIEKGIEIGKYMGVSLGIFTNDYDLIAGEKEGLLKLIIDEEHYWVIKSKVNVCPLCKKIWMKSHQCREEHTKDYYKERKEHQNFIYNAGKLPIKNNENEFVLHYDIETYARVQGERKIKAKKGEPEKQSKTIYNNVPYIVGCAYYPAWYERGSLFGDNEPRYLTFTGDDCMKQFYDFLGCDELKHIKYINAYNGANFDHYYLFQEMLKVQSDKVGKYILNNGQLLTATIQGKKLWDLNRHLVGTLAQNLESNNCQIVKGELDHDTSTRWEVTSPERREKCEEYLKCDVMGLMELTEIMNDTIQEKFSFNMYQFVTFSSMCDKVWSQRFLRKGWKCEKPKPHKEKVFRECIIGGRTTKFKKHFKSKQLEEYKAGLISYEEITDYIFDLDVVSLYPQIMKVKKYPVGESIYISSYEQFERLDYKKKINKAERMHDKLGMYYVRYKANKSLLVPPIGRKVDKDDNGRKVRKLMWDLEDGEGWMSSVDIKNAEKRGYIFDRDFDDFQGYYWEKSEYIFKDYIEYMYKAKASAKKGTPAYLLAKIGLNSLYGKQLQSTIREKSTIVKNAGGFWKILKDNTILSMTQVGKTWVVNYQPFAEESEDTAMNASKATQNGVFILAYSRELMLEYYDKCGNDIENMMSYCDTDSMNIHSSLLKQYGGVFEINKELGGMDDDVGGKVMEAIWIAPKMYSFNYISKEDKKLDYHYRGKGVPNKLLTWDAFEKMKEGQSQDFVKKFQFRKINTSLNSSDVKNGFEHFSTTQEKNILKTVNKEEWAGRDFYHSSIPKDKIGELSVPWGYDPDYVVDKQEQKENAFLVR